MDYCFIEPTLLNSSDDIYERRTKKKSDGNGNMYPYPDTTQDLTLSLLANGTEDHESYDVEDTDSILKLALQVLKITFPLCINYVCGIFEYTLVFFFIASKGINYTEAFSLVLTYWDTIFDGVLYGFTIGFGILGSNAFGAKNLTKLGYHLNRGLSLQFINSGIIVLLNLFVIPYIFLSFDINKEAYDIFCYIIKILTLNIPIFGAITIFIRYTTIIHDQYILSSASLCGLISHSISCLFFIYYLDLDYIGICICLIVNYIATFSVLYYNIYINKVLPESIIPFSFRSFKGVWTMAKFSIFPMFTYILWFISTETVSLFALKISDIDFTVFNVFNNIFQLLMTFSESLGAANTILVSFYIGKNDKKKAYRAFFVSLMINFTFISLGLLCIIFNRRFILSLYSSDAMFLESAEGTFWVFCLSCSITVFHPLVAEFIIAIGDQEFSLYSILLGRIFVQFSYIFATVILFNGDLKSIYHGIIIGQIICFVCFIIYFTRYLNIDQFIEYRERNLMITRKSSFLLDKEEKDYFNINYEDYDEGLCNTIR